MLFNSPEFLFGFLPIFLFLYFLAFRALRNLILFLASLLFYFTMSGELTAILVLSVFINWVLALHLVRVQGRTRSAWLTAGVFLNLLPLSYYKYAHFFLGTAHDLFDAIGIAVSLPHIDPPLPIGISFFTFQALSYIIDIARDRIAPARSLINFGMYHCCFPQLIAGPIVRYEEIADRVSHRRLILEDVHNGVVQFCFGLGKKVVLADSCGRIADAVFQLPDSGRGFAAAWIGIAAYSLQIYFDFSGYSDMAIGLGRILGFWYPENFNQPYLSHSVTEFWRRWHMTLSRWFRDYVYIPLGGNRAGLARTSINLVVVFFLCGLWHGAAYTFILWGLVHGFLLLIERVGRHYTGWRPLPLFGWAYTLFVITLAWVPFRAENLTQAGHYVIDLLTPSLGLPTALYATLTPDKIFIALLATALALTPYSPFVRFVDGRYYFGPLLSVGSLVIVLLAFIMMSVNGFSPFIYFRF